VIKSSKVV